jgi:hypothetical protein
MRSAVLCAAVSCTTLVPTRLVGQERAAPGVSASEIRVGNIACTSGPSKACAVVAHAEAAYFQMINARGAMASSGGQSGPLPASRKGHRTQRRRVGQPQNAGSKNEPGAPGILPATSSAQCCFGTAPAPVSHLSRNVAKIRRGEGSAAEGRVQGVPVRPACPPASMAWNNKP